MSQYFISLPDPSKAHGNDADLSFRSQSAGGFAEELEAALRTTGLFDRWRAKQPDPDAVEPQWGATDPNATVTVSRRTCASTWWSPPPSTAMC